MKIGEYIRTKFGIRKIKDITKDECYNPRVKVLILDEFLDTTYRFDYVFYSDEKTIKGSKHSFDVIDLIKVGDYVNDERITRVIPEDICSDEVLDHQHIFIGDKEIYEEDIESIVTKEEFESRKYRVGGKYD